MSYVAVVWWNAEGRVGKYQEYSLESAARDHVSRISQRYPSAFVAAHPGGNFASWLVRDGALVNEPAVSVPPVLTLAQRMAKFEKPGDVARKVEEVLDHLINGAALSPQAAKWVSDRKAERVS